MDKKLWNGKVAQIFGAYTIVALLGLLRDVTLSFKYGTSFVSDAFILSTTLQNILFVGISTSVLQAFIPLYFDVDNRLHQGDRFVVSLIKKFTPLMAIYGVLLILCRDLFTSTIGVHFSHYGKEAFGILLIGTFVYGMLMPSTNICVGFLRCKSKFFLSGIIFIPGTISIIAGIAFSTKEHLIYITYGYIVGILLSLATGFVAMKKNGLGTQPNEDDSHCSLRPFVILLIPLVFRDILVSSNTMISQLFASSLTEGTVASLGYAFKLITLVTALFISVVTIVLLPMLSKNQAIGNFKGIDDIVFSAIVGVESMIIPLSAYMMVFGRPIIATIFYRGAFGQEALESTTSALVWYSMGLAFLAFNNIISMLLLAKKSTRSILVSSLLMIIFNLAFCIVLIPTYQGSGIAVAASISYFAASIFLGYCLLRQTSRKLLAQVIQKIAVISLVTLISSALIGLIFRSVSSAIEMGHYDLLIVAMSFVVFTAVIFGLYKLAGLDKIIKETFRVLEHVGEQE